MKTVRYALVNFLIVIGLIGSIVFLVVILSEIIRFSKKKTLNSHPKCVRASCAKVYDEISWSKKHFIEFNKLKYHYESPNVFKSNIYSGETINIEQDLNGNYNLRRTIITKNENLNKYIFFFGGSIVWGYGANDNNTIPSIFQNFSGYNVKNMAEVGWTSDQSLSYLIKLLRDGYKPDHVIFINGVNDVNYKCSYESEHAQIYEEMLSNIFNGKIRKIPATSFENYFSIPIEFISKIKTKFISSKLEETINQDSQSISKCVSSNLGEKISKNLVNNWLLAEKLVTDYGGNFYAFLGPHIVFQNKKVDESIIWNRESSLISQYVHIYNIVDGLIDKHKYFYNFKDIFNNHTEYFFIDQHHLGPQGNKIFAEKIYDLIKNDLNK